MKDPISLIKIGWKSGFAVLTATTLFVGGLALNLNTALAASPNLTINYLVANNDGSGSYGDSIEVGVGETIILYAGIHNTNVGSVAENITFQANVPSSTGTSTATVSADNHGAVSDDVHVTVNGGTLEYIPGSALMTWNELDAGGLEYDNSVISDSIVAGGLTLGNQKGCNDYIIQISFLATVVEDEPEPSPEDCDDCGGDQNQEQEQEQEVNVDVDVNQENNQTVNITNPAPPVVAGKKIPVKQPETGVSVLGLAGMAGAAPVGVALSRFGKGRLVGKREEEGLGEFVSGILENRFGKRNDA